MGRIKVTAGQSQAAWQPLPRGTYDFDIDSIEEKVTRNDNQQLVMKMTVVDGPMAGKKATHFLVISEKTGGFVKEMVEATGIDYEQVELDEINEEDGKPFVSIDFDSDDMIGKRVRADAIISEWEGKENNKFNRFRSVTAEEAEAPAKSQSQSRTSQSANKGAAANTKAAAPATGRAAPAAGNQQRRSRV